MLLVKWKLCAATWLKFCNRQEDLGQVYRWDKEMRQNTLFASGTCKDTDTATETQISGAIKTSPTARGSGIEKWLLLHPSSTVPSKSPAPDDFRSRWKDKPELEDVSIKTSYQAHCRSCWMTLHGQVLWEGLFGCNSVSYTIYYM